MPTYEYLCPSGHEFDLFQKMSDKPRAKCPTCGKPATRKISGGAGLVFKGSGFYITDYGKDGKGPRKEESAKSDAPEKSEAKAEPSGESKSESSKEPKAEPKPAKADKPASKKAKK